MKELKEKIEQALENIRPYLKADGGDVRLLDVSPDYQVTLELLGACGTCKMSAMTMKAGIEESIKKMAPEVTSVIAVNETPL